MARFGRPWRMRAHIGLVALIGAFLVLGATSPDAVAPRVGLGRGLDASVAPETVSAEPDGVAPHPLDDSILAALNDARQAHGEAACVGNDDLAALATGWAGTIAGGRRLRHNDLAAALEAPDLVGFRTLGESLYVGPDRATAGDVVSAWMSTATHRANLLATCDAVGIGAVVADAKLWVVAYVGGSW